MGKKLERRKSNRKGIPTLPYQEGKKQKRHNKDEQPKGMNQYNLNPQKSEKGINGDTSLTPWWRGKHLETGSTTGKRFTSGSGIQEDDD